MIRVAVALGIVLEAIEILRRTPRWLLILLGLLGSCLVLLVITYFWWIAGGLAGLALFRIVRQRS
jgi:hypothetical protein